MDAQLKLELEAAAFRRLQYHLINDRTDVSTRLLIFSVVDFPVTFLIVWSDPYERPA